MSQQSAAGGAVSTVIPYKNVFALIAYYCGIFSLIPGLGALLGPAGLILGILGLKKRKSDPNSKGLGHCLVGIIIGGLVTLGHLLIIIMIVANG